MPGTSTGTGPPAAARRRVATARTSFIYAQGTHKKTCWNLVTWHLACSSRFSQVMGFRAFVQRYFAPAHIRLLTVKRSPDAPRVVESLSPRCLPSFHFAREHGSCLMKCTLACSDEEGSMLSRATRAARCSHDSRIACQRSQH